MPTLLAGQITAIAAGGENSLALRADGIVLSWGINETGQLGSGSAVAGLPAGAGAGDSASAGVDRDRLRPRRRPGPRRGVAAATAAVWSWGWNTNGQLGNGTSGPSSASTVPVQVGGLNLN